MGRISCIPSIPKPFYIPFSYPYTNNGTAEEQLKQLSVLPAFHEKSINNRPFFILVVYYIGFYLFIYKKGKIKNQENKTTLISKQK
ncbi:hypothetical protein [Bacillus sp. MUM 13]|uniref:hypothetical protein n=1 Tax=Bacillus sp. MUM 13 TaxID=1678001 RepID=UPI0008F5C889|nr:hypothetical protein [Bacillus sp. MUM 13]OIK09925.1 hypothetical protein BIV59_15830 [Bacillus sp. MUM 13]